MVPQVRAAGGSARCRGQRPQDTAGLPRRAHGGAQAQPAVGARGGLRGRVPPGWAWEVLRFSIPGAEGTREANKGGVETVPC